MLIDVLILFLGFIIGASLMFMAVDYKDKHVRAEMAKTEHFRMRYEQARVLLAHYNAGANLPVATSNNGIDVPLPPVDQLFTAEDQEALNRGERVVRMRRGGAK